ncbi:MAG: ChbG/HpnK family deacetylase [Candidatus Margulisbacteria bacterium]|nr:ChbG/HpnK family deacetylase [Candidatus Margulisiibacteriota bacterium]
MNEKYLIVNADDFGLNTGVNRAIIETFQNGIVTSTTLMVNCPSTKEGVELAKQNPQLGVGLHFNLTQGKPMSGKINSLTDQKGFFLKRSQFEIRLLAGKIKKEDIIQELNLQWDIFLSLGLKPTHLDSHQHIHIYPKVFPIVLDFVNKKNLPLRIPNEKIIFTFKPDLKYFYPSNLIKLYKKIYLNIYAQRARETAAKTKCLMNQHFYSVFSYWPAVKTLHNKLYKKIIKELPAGISELMCHPAHLEQPTYYSTSITHLSQQEVMILQEDTLKKILKECNIQLIHYGNLKEILNG